MTATIRTALLTLAALAPLPTGCTTDDPASDGSTAGSTGNAAGTSSGSGSGSDPTVADSSGASGADTTGGTADPTATAEFFARWPGLWVGPVDSMTSAGDFPTMNMDVRPADGHTLFSRTDLDGGNSLRMAMVVEQHDGEDVLVFRNGGYFLGILRDSRTRLVEADLEAERWRFCSIDAGCEYVDAVFDFEGPDALDMHVDVRGTTHFDWPATRAELREIDGPFPVDDTPQPGDAPFPEMPTLEVTLTWTTPLAEASDAWVILSTTACNLGGGCTPSRFIRGHADAGATSLVLTLEQIHADDYKANAILDRNGNLAGTFLPDAGDTVSIPNSNVSVDATGTTEVSLPLLVDL
ncbi:MAG: hypothetical protein JNK45_26585 [Myxococcales bacterium]|nr:hypothetical protein [Myxococcales bacterium]